ncbi:MAG: tRNA (adenosine(37)-N6)-threonylcarbamoyltransferase complex transferase subunit TsaD, partial [Phycisphaerales bacterium]|nr:tRNA (adenosine(37)-N6)-threonylcarbamoyltransferase complex transferase subunit TsaD [Phycisphaerales bacterium]
VPEIASRAHVERILPVLRHALADAGCTLADIDAVAVGHRPGLIGALIVVVAAAKALAFALERPVIGVDHVHAHLYAGLLDRDPAAEPPDDLFPALGLVVSGGHTALYRCDTALDVARIGSTIDDAVGEAYDKAAMMLGLPHPGGPRIDRLAQQGNPRAHDFPVSRLDPDSLDFSFSGLKTAVLYTIRGRPARIDGRTTFARDHQDLGEEEKADVAASFQRAAARAVTLKMRRALDTMPDTRAILVGGGVSANSAIRSAIVELGKQRRLEVRLPRMDLCMDNAAMLAGLAHLRFTRGDVDDLSLAASPMSAIT